MEPESRHVFSFFGAFFGKIDITTKADNNPPPPPDPTVSISPGADITEGADATFTISVSPAQTTSLDVTVTVSQSGNYALPGQQTVTVPSSGSYTLTVGTTNDATDELDGSVTASIDSGIGYTVSSSSGSATVTVADDDVPELSIASGGNVTEGANASFTISATPTPHTERLLSPSFLAVTTTCRRRKVPRR